MKTESELQAAVSRLLTGRGVVGVAVSGGGDSAALLVLAVEVLGASQVRAATVDHGLRPEAAGEAASVAALCARLGVEHAVLRWEGPAGGNLMDAARRGRQRLLADWARAGGLGAVALAHTLDDQAETVLMRLARGSGVDGLSGMAEARAALGILWLRPFLGVSRAALRAELAARGIPWAEDPTNADTRFARTRARAALAALAPLGIGAAGLAATAARMARARAALEADEAAARVRLVRDDRGTVLVDPAALDLAPEMRDRLFAGLIGGLSGAEYRPRLAALHRWLTGGALSGVLLRHEAAGLRLSREPRAVAGLRASTAAVWDRRWRAEGPGEAEIAALGEAGLAQLGRQARAGLHPHWRGAGLAPAVLAGLPAIWQGDRLLAAPLALWPQGWQLRARPLAAGESLWGESD